MRWSYRSFSGSIETILDWFVTSKMIKKRYTVLYTYDGLPFFDKNYGDIIFFCNEMVILGVNRHDINLDNNFDEDDRDTII